MISVLLSASVWAQPVSPEASDNVGWQDSPVELTPSSVWVERLGLPSPRISPFPARRRSARQRARSRATAALHAYADRVLAAALESPAVATEVHAAIDAHAQVEAVRPLTDGSAVVRVTVPRDRLRTLTTRDGIPW